MYLEIDEGFLDHPKTLRLCGMLKDANGWAYVVRLWRWACRSAPDGSLEGMTPGEIEIAAGYRPLDGKLYEALASRFIDEKDGKPFALHDWMRHQGRSIRKMMSRAEAIRRGNRDRKKRQRERDVSTDSGHAFVTRDENVTSRPVTHPVQTSPDKSRQEKEESSAETEDRSPPPPPVMVFPASGKQPSWNMTQAFLDEAIAAYPRVDVFAESRVALAKVKTGATRKPTARGYPRFLMSWYARANDNGPPRAIGPPVRPVAIPVPIQPELQQRFQGAK